MTAAVDSEAAKFSMLWFSLVRAAPWVVLPEDMALPQRRCSASGGAGRVGSEFVRRDPCKPCEERRGSSSRWARGRNGLRGGGTVLGAKKDGKLRQRTKGLSEGVIDS
jgi:hypothetical protein